MKETIGFHDSKFNLKTKTAFIDRLVWRISYTKGYREPNFPVPAIPLEVSISKNVVLVIEKNYNSKLLRRNHSYWSKEK